MKPIIIIFVIAVFGMGFGLSIAVSAEEGKIPSWVRTNALWWGEEKISDFDYLQGLQYLIDNELLQVADSKPSDTTLEAKIKQLENENKNLKSNMLSLEVENKKLRSIVDNSNSQPNPSSMSYPSHDCQGSAKCFSETVTRIVDGDTIYTTNHKIRLSLSTTPERDEAGYSAASAFTEILCPVGSTVLVDQDDLQHYDKYGRLLANVYCDDKSLNSELLYNGHANILTKYCSTSEFSSSKWASDFGCGVKSNVTAKTSQTVTKPTDNCDSSYTDFCIPSPPPDLDCGDISQKRFTVLPPDPHRFDGDKDGIGCES